MSSSSENHVVPQYYDHGDVVNVNQSNNDSKYPGNSEFYPQNIDNSNQSSLIHEGNGQDMFDQGQRRSDNNYPRYDAAPYHHDQPTGNFRIDNISPDYSSSSQLTNSSHQELPYSYHGLGAAGGYGMMSLSEGHHSQRFDGDDNFVHSRNQHISSGEFANSSQPQSNHLPKSVDFYPDSSSLSKPFDHREGFGIGDTRPVYNGSSKSQMNTGHFEDVGARGGGEFDMTSYHRGVRMRRASSGESLEDYSLRYTSNEFQRGKGKEGGVPAYENFSVDQDSFSVASSTSGVSSSSWIHENPRDGGVFGNDSGRNLRQPPQQQQPHYETNSSWKYHTRQPGTSSQLQHIQQVHPRSSSSYGGHSSGFQGGGRSEHFHNYGQTVQQHALSKYMDSGNRLDVQGMSKYMPRHGPRPNLNYGGQAGRHDMHHHGQHHHGQHHVQHQYHQPQKYYDQPSYLQTMPRNDRGFNDGMSGYDRVGAAHNNKVLRGVPMNPPVVGRGAMKGNSRTGEIVRDVELEEVIYRNTQIILSETANKRLKSVELANALRDRIGKDYLARTKTLYGGLLVLLELHRETFRVQRVPKNDMVELLIPYQGEAAAGNSFHSSTNGGRSFAKTIGAPQSSLSAPQLVPEAMGLDSADMERKQQAHQMPGWGRQWETATSHPINDSKSQESKKIQPIQPSTCLYIREIPDDATAAQIFADFGGSGIVEKVHINKEGLRRTGLIWFLTVSGALRALSIPLSSWRPYLSFHYASDEHDFELLEEADAASVAKLCEAMAAISILQRQDCDSPNNSNRNDREGIALSPSSKNTLSTSHSHLIQQGLDIDMFNMFRDKKVTTDSVSDESQGLHSLLSPNDGSNMMMWGSSKMKISGLSSEKPPPGNTTKLSSSSEDDCVESKGDLSHDRPDLDKATSSLSDRRPAPPPILTSFANDEQLLTSRSPSSAISYQLTNSPNAACLSSPGTTDAFFAFQDEDAPGGVSILAKDNLPAPMIEVMNTLCDVVYVPQKIWERKTDGDYPFVQVIVDILSVIFQNAFVQLTKLKQQVKKRLGGSIRIGPLKALLQAYPEYFEMDKNMTLVRSLKTELPLMNIKDVNLQK